MEINATSKFTKLSAISEISTESGTDYTLPDYQGDVRRVLVTECRAKPASCYSDESGDEFSGIVTYDVIYLDSEGRMTHASFTSDYDLRLKGATGHTRTIASVGVGSFSVRLTGPRRFSAKATVCAGVKCISEEELNPTGSVFSADEKPETLKRLLKVRSADKSETLEREYAERLERLEGQIADEIEILHSGAEICFTDAVPEEDSIRLKGTLRLYALVQNGDLPIYLVEKDVPVDELVTFVGINDGAHFIPRYEIVSSVAVVSADDEGAEIALNAIVEYEVACEYNEAVDAMIDAYAVGHGTKNEYTDYGYGELVACLPLSDNMSCEISSSDITADKIRAIPYLNGTPKIERAEVAGGQVLISGELKAVGVASVIGSEGDISYTGIKLSCPFEKQIKLGTAVTESASAECFVRALNVKCAVDTDSVIVDFKLSGAVTVTEKKRESLLVNADVEDGEDEPSSEGVITVYYPTSDDTLFSVAKKFRKGCEQVAECNGLTVSTSTDGSGGALLGVERLYIY